MDKQLKAGFTDLLSKINGYEEKIWKTQQKLLSLIYEIQSANKLDYIDINGPEYYSNYEDRTTPIIAIKVEKDSRGRYELLISADDGNGFDFFCPFADGNIEYSEIAQALMRKSKFTAKKLKALL